MIGTGNVATVLSKKIVAAGHVVAEVCGRNPQATEIIATAIDAKPIHNAGMLSSESDLYIIAVSDTALNIVVSQLSLRNKMIVHTAGSVSKEILAPATKNYGVLYPLQSLRKEMTALPEIPFLVDGNTSDDLTLVADFASSISDTVRVANDEKRQELHLAAVFVSNFTNHLYALSEGYCNTEGVDFKLLLPIIEEVAERTKRHSPAKMQTGPALRGDVETMERHIALLKKFPAMQELYIAFSNSIRQFYALG